MVNSDFVLEWKSNRLCDESIKTSSTASNFLDPSLNHIGTKTRVKFSGGCLKQDKITYNHGKIVNIYMVYEITKNYNVSSYAAQENYLFGAVIFNLKYWYWQVEIFRIWYWIW